MSPHLSNELKFLDYNKIKNQIFYSLPITFNDDIIFEFLPICFLTAHFRQMQGMDRKYDGHVWCKLKTSNIKINFGLEFWSNQCLGHLCRLNDSCENFLHSIMCKK